MHKPTIEQQAEDIILSEWRHLARGGEPGSTQPMRGEIHAEPDTFALWIAPPESWHRAGRYTLLPCQVYQRMSTDDENYTFLTECTNTMQAMQYIERLTGCIVTIAEQRNQPDGSSWFTITRRSRGYPARFSPRSP